MSKEEAFKVFITKHPELVSYVKNKEHTWQEFYEIYDLYGEDENVWSKFQDNDENRAIPIAELMSLLKGININNVQKYISNAQKAINVIQELTAKAPPKINNIPKGPRPITKFFGD